MLDENPYIIQEPLECGDRGPSLPLILIHDGSATTFAYHCIEELDRPVYGVFHPDFLDGQGCQGSIPEMAAQYLDLIRHSVSVGTILLGGQLLVLVHKHTTDAPLQAGHSVA